jgi:hypothetical protein
MDKIFKDKDEEKAKAERAKFDPDMWTDDQWTNPEPLHFGFLLDYAPVKERQIQQDLAQMYVLEDIPNEKGFYLTARGRRAYHQLVTTCVWNALLYLKLLKKHEACVDKNYQDNSDIRKLTDEASWALNHLEMLAYRNPIIGIHLDWLDKKIPNHKRKLDEVQNLPNGDITGEAADILPSLKALALNGPAGAAEEPSSRYLISGGRGAAVLRWLRLITLHHFSIWTLLSTATVQKLPQLSINLVQTRLPYEPHEMQSLESYFRDMKNPPRSEDITLIVEGLQRQETDNVDVFKGTYHCEAILLSLYLLSYETRNADESFDDLSRFYQALGVPRILADDAGNFFTRVVAVSKRCCPVCNELFRVMERELGNSYNIMGSHTTYSPCALPFFLPKKYADMVADELEKRLEPQLKDYITVQRHRRKFDRGTQSPVSHLVETHDEDFRSEGT